MTLHSLKKIVVFCFLTWICLHLLGLSFLHHEQSPKPFWDTIPNKKASYIYSPGLIGSEIIMGRYCPQYTAITGEKITWKKGGHVIGQPHTCVVYPDVNLRKPTCFTLNPITRFINGVRKDLFPLAEQYLNEKYGITVVDNPNSHYTVVNYIPQVTSANIGQKKDINALHTCYHRHIKKHPHEDVILYGDSRGAATIFNFIAQYKPKKVKAAVLEGIFDTVPHCVKHFLWEKKGPVVEERLHQLLSMVMWKYRKNGINPKKCAEIIDDNTPLLLVTSLNDGLVPPQGTLNMYKRLKERGHQKVHILVLKKSLHPLYMIDDPHDQQMYETVVHAFYKHYDLPHNSIKAAQGSAAFLGTQPSLQQLKLLYPLATCELCHFNQST